MISADQQLYQAIILEHNKKPKNFRKIEQPTHAAEGFNPLCGDHYWIYLNVDEQGKINDVSFEGQGCAISKASASMMTAALIGKNAEQAEELFQHFHSMLMRGNAHDGAPSKLGKLEIFSGIWKFPTRVKCAALAWHAMKGALDKKQTVSTEVDDEVHS